MTPTQKRRLGWTLFMAASVAVAVALSVNAFRSNLLFFFTPTQVASGEALAGALVRVGGLVAEGSVTREQGSLAVSFDVTDTANAVTVTYEGILPDLFQEGQGVVVKGRLTEGGAFVATEVLAKHDENYMPPEAAAALEAARTVEIPR